MKVSGFSSAQHFIGLSGAASSYLLWRLHAEVPKLAVLTPSRKEAEQLYEDLKVWKDPNELILFPPWESLPWEPVSPSLETSAARLKAIDSIKSNSKWILILPVETALQRIIPQRFLKKLSFKTKVNEPLSISDLVAQLDLAGFRRTSRVEELGQYAVRGQVLDLFTSTHTLPIRLFFDQKKIEAIKLFDVDSQITTESIQSFNIIPVKEIIPVEILVEEDPELKQASQRMKLQAKKLEVQPRDLEKLIKEIWFGSLFPAAELIQYFLVDQYETIFDILPKDSKLALFDSDQIKACIESMHDVISDRYERISKEHHLIPTPEAVYLNSEDLNQCIEKPEVITLASLGHGESTEHAINIHSHPIFELPTRLKSKIGSGDAYEPLRDFLDTWRKKKYRIAFVIGAKTRAERLQAILLDINISAPIENINAGIWVNSESRSPVAILFGHLSAGFRLADEKIVFVSEAEIFQERSFRGAARKVTSAKKILSTLASLKEEDFVVHVDFGIGVYKGLRHIPVESVIGDFLQIDYADSTLYLPVQNISRIQKFLASEDQKPVIDKLGSTRWVRAKHKIRQSVITLAGDLIKLYASRQSAKGWRFEPTGAEDDRFADTFSYDETPDQLKAIQDTLLDMASDKPMDRLVCGDVGFGKTEVAIRAAFKCTQHARQVAILVPTTILVEQHRSNFENRFTGYPVKIGAVSRFYSAEQNRRTLQAVADGEIDIIIGTHRLIQSDVTFKDLGLLIIDEEHRFGVKQKERLKQMRAEVDVLTLTATPIPRTLHMALLSLRDISVINTPPLDRRVIQTFVAEREESLIRDVVLRELRRGGQCFFIYNRVQGIDIVTARLAELIPEANFDFAHGQMKEDKLEKIMKRFLDKEVDVLVSTTIIESGLDIPNANSIIIDRADTFGLAQLYQLRGRVGRSSRQAFSYLMVPNTKKITKDASERLKVLQSLDDLGVGFNLAIRDLEIRGAGNLLGKEQSGNVLSVGFEMYCSIVQEAVAELRGVEPELESIVDPEIKFIGIDAYIPESYVPDVAERLVLYQRLSSMRDPSEADQILKEFQDRFGNFGIEVDNLIELMRLRTLFRHYGIVKADIAPARTALTFSPVAILDPQKGAKANTRVDGANVIALVKKNPKKYRFSKNLSLIIFNDKEEVLPPARVYRKLEALLESLR